MLLFLLICIVLRLPSHVFFKVCIIINSRNTSSSVLETVHAHPQQIGRWTASIKSRDYDLGLLAFSSLLFAFPPNDRPNICPCFTFTLRFDRRLWFRLPSLLSRVLVHLFLLVLGLRAKRARPGFSLSLFHRCLRDKNMSVLARQGGNEARKSTYCFLFRLVGITSLHNLDILNRELHN